jgi:hypothetical protein
MRPFHIAYLVALMFLLATSQILLKVGVMSARDRAKTNSFFDFMVGLGTDWHFWASMAVCGGIVLAWSWLLTMVPLSKAYPFVVLAFVFAGILEHFVFGQVLAWRFFAGCCLIGSGLLVVLSA